MPSAMGERQMLPVQTTRMRTGEASMGPEGSGGPIWHPWSGLLQP